MNHFLHRKTEFTIVQHDDLGIKEEGKTVKTKMRGKGRKVLTMLKARQQATLILEAKI